MSGSVDNVYLYIIIADRGIFCKYRDTSLTLDVIRVHNALCDILILSECAALLEHFVHESSLSVVNVRYYSDVS